MELELCCFWNPSCDPPPPGGPICDGPGGRGGRGGHGSPGPRHGGYGGHGGHRGHGDHGGIDGLMNSKLGISPTFLTN